MFFSSVVEAIFDALRIRIVQCITWILPKVKENQYYPDIMSTTQFNSTSFFLSKWAQEKDTPTAGKSRIELDIVEDPNSREVCIGNNCSLYFDQEADEYITMGRCQRVSLCTESRIIKDHLFIRDGNISSTVNCLNYEKQLLNWV